MENKQTAVEWLIVQIKDDHNNNALTGLEWKKIFDQAKAMEEQQLNKAWEDGAVTAQNNAAKEIENNYVARVR